MDIVSALLTDATYSALCQISYGEYLKNAFESQDYGLDLLTELTVHSANLPFNKCIWIFLFYACWFRHLHAWMFISGYTLNNTSGTVALSGN